ncbi:TonB-dependent receptor plug domain-containing protein [Novosphingobium sp. PP1Y]|uniref:TonB-dependent receptor plug domain-containing protein n=1 Tax=Novosphingobium sp. PP1Y TaxID=702113 RepID=UPI0002F63A17|nr:TonB-dependent receptor plug domain-containing protein [Novosphingobium sp. PP1Y]
MRSHLWLPLITGASLPSLAFAQVTAPATIIDEDDDAIEVNSSEIVVVAPRFRGQIDVPNQPVQTFDEEDIAAYGADSIADLIAAISPQTGSGRGRGSGRPVILVNGQRITSFRELHRIPPEAIRRMEVLPEEVALRFGYPANQRVLNMILKDNFASLVAAGEYNVPTRGGYDNYEAEGGIFKISGPRRYNFSAKLTETTMLTEDERNIRQSASGQPTVAGDPDPARYRSLADAASTLELNGTMTQGIGEGGLAGSITVNGAYTHEQTTSLSGLDTVTLSYGGDNEIRTLPDPLTTRSVVDTFEGGLGYNTMIGDWTFSTTADGSYTDTNTRTDRRRDTDALVAAAASGALAIGGALPAVPGAGVDVARNRALALATLTTLSGRPFRMPAGDASLTIKGGFDFNRTTSEDSRTDIGAFTLRRSDVSGGVNLAVPLTSRGEDFLGAVGDFTLNVGGGIDHLSDFGSLKNWNLGLTWNPTDTLSFQASYLVEDAAPSLSQLGAPTILTYNVSVYDFTNSTTSLVTVTSGGNPDLVKEKQRDIKLSATWKLPFLDRSNLLVEYFRNRSSDVTKSFPLLTPAIEAAFPGRVTRDAFGNLIAIDRRAVTYDEVSTSSMRWGFNISGKLGSDSASGGGASRGSSRTAAPVHSAPSTPPGGFDGPPPAGGGAFDPSRFEALRKSLCAPEGEGTASPDLSVMPERMRERLVGADGKVDPDKLEKMKQRVCSAEGPGAAGSFDPERFARMRQAVCAQGSTGPDLSKLPEPVVERLKGSDGQVDKARLAAMRERMCSNGGARAPEAGAAPVEKKQSGESSSGGGGSQRSGFGPPGGGRWNLSVYHTWRIVDRVRIAPGVPELDELAGDAISAGGVPRHSIEMEGGLFKNGYGLRLKGEWNAPAKVNGSGLPGSSDLRFGSTFVLDARLFVDLGRMESLVAKAPFFKGARLALTADNLLDSRQKVTDGNGAVPLAYQAAYREPQGRVVGIDFRKMF